MKNLSPIVGVCGISVDIEHADGSVSYAEMSRGGLNGQWYESIDTYGLDMDDADADVLIAHVHAALAPLVEADLA